MNPRSVLPLALISLSPSLLFAQSPPAEPPAAPEPARVAIRPQPTLSSVPTAPPTAPPIPSVRPTSEAPEVLQAPPAPKVAPAPAATTAPAAPPAPPRAPAQMLNVQIEVTLADSKGPSKTVLLTVADGEMGQNRTQTFGTSNPFTFNADARPVIVGSKIRLHLTAEATIPGTGLDSPDRTPSLNLRQSQMMILNDGISVEIARAADPVSSRAFALSVKATIQR